MIDSRDFIAARKRAERDTLIPPGPKIVVTGGADYNDHRLIWDRLDRAHARHPDMTLIHGGSPKGAELIASKWATARNVPQIAFRPDWTTHAKAAPFKRNDAVLETLPIGVMVFPGNGIQDNLADKACKLGFPVWRIACTPEPGRRSFADRRRRRTTAAIHSQPLARASMAALRRQPDVRSPRRTRRVR